MSSRAYYLPMRYLLVCACLVILPPGLGAQGLPAFAPINPVAASRTGLGFEPYRGPVAGWAVTTGLDYASTIESNRLPAASYYLDSELLRATVEVRHDLGERTFAYGSGQLLGAYAGFLDGFLDWYHGLLGIHMPEREERPRDEFLYSVHPPSGQALGSAPSDLFLGDTRLGVGIRWTPHLQSVAALTLPTSTGPEGYGRGVVSVNVLNTVRATVAPRLVYEGSLGLGHTPSHGRLAAFQREMMVSASSGLRFGIWGRLSLFGNLFYHSPYYDGTTLPALERRELSFDFGGVLARSGGGELRVGMTEDFEPGGPAVDLVFRLGASF